MAETAQMISYFSLTVANKCGEAARVLTGLAEAGINLIGFWGYPLKGKKAQLDIVAADAKALAKALKKMGLDAGPKKTGFFVAGDDTAGALCAAASKLAGAGINIYAAQAVSANCGCYGAIFQVAAEDVKKAKKALGA
jgi:hypothetical protein